MVRFEPYVAILGGSDGYVEGQSEYVGLKRKILVQDARRGMEESWMGAGKAQF